MKMGRFPSLCRGIVFIMAVTGFSGTAHAIKTFARLYNMKCETCHSTVPNLNEFGTAFLAKGLKIPGQDGRETQGENGSAKGEGTAGATARKADGIEPGKESEKGAKVPGSSGKSAGAELPGEPTENTTTQPPAAVTPTVVYKVPSRDGSIYYTDNLTRTDSLNAERVPEFTKPGTKHRMPPLSREQQVQRRMPALQPTSRVTIAKEKESVRYRNYSECMEQELDGTSPPDSAQEMMDLFRATEKKCAPYQTGKRQHGRNE
jgi:hypothetical protein